MATPIIDVIRERPVLIATLDTQGKVLLLDGGMCTEGAWEPRIADALPIQVDLGDLFLWGTARSAVIRSGAWSALIERGGRTIDARLKRFVVDGVDCFLLTCVDLSRTTENAQQRALPEQNLQLAAALLDAEERTREGISRDLHDHLGQKLTASRHLVTALKLRISDKGNVVVAEVLEELDAISDAFADVQRALKSLLRSMWPETLNSCGLASAVEDLTDEIRGISTGTSFTFLADERTRAARLEPLIEITAYRFCQEALNNVVKHASASECRISLAVEPSDEHPSLTVVVADNGIGIATNVRRDARGLIGMRERATAIGGCFSRRSQPGGGTKISLEIPLNDRVKNRFGVPT